MSIMGTCAVRDDAPLPLNGTAEVAEVQLKECLVNSLSHHVSLARTESASHANPQAGGGRLSYSQKGMDG